MNELIKIETQTLDNEEVNTVNARELHEFLESRQDFSTWIKKRIKDYDFVENQDFLSLHKKMEREVGATSRVEYYISLDMAKELAMVERSEKGREARKYFIECEKRLKDVMFSKDSLLLGIFKAEGDIAKAEAINRYETGYVRPLENKVEEQAEIITQQAPKVEYHDDVLKAEGLMNISQIAKDFGMTAQKLNKILPCIGKSGRSVLHEKGIQFKQRGQWLLYKDYQDKGYTKSETFLTASGLSVVNTKWTQKGRQFIYELLKEETCE